MPTLIVCALFHHDRGSENESSLGRIGQRSSHHIQGKISIFGRCVTKKIRPLNQLSLKYTRQSEIEVLSDVVSSAYINPCCQLNIFVFNVAKINAAISLERLKKYTAMHALMICAN